MPELEHAKGLKSQFISLIDEHKNKLTDPVEMLDWVHLRVVINVIPLEDFARYLGEAEKVLSQ